MRQADALTNKLHHDPISNAKPQMIYATFHIDPQKANSVLLPPLPSWLMFECLMTTSPSPSAIFFMVDGLPETVEGLYSKRPIQCLVSSELLTPHPLTARRGGLPLVRGEDTLAAWRGGGGSLVRKTPDTALYSIYVITLCLRRWGVGRGGNKGRVPELEQADRRD